MVSELIELIDEIVKYGLQPNLDVENRMAMLERDLIKLYATRFEIPDVVDENKYEDFDDSMPELRKNIESNFPGVGYYKMVLDITNFEEWDDIGTGDAIDDLHDIIKDLLEVKWRIQHNSDADGLWHFRFSFDSHIKDHVLDLLKYINEAKHKARA